MSSTTFVNDVSRTTTINGGGGEWGDIVINGTPLSAVSSTQIQKSWNKSYSVEYINSASAVNNSQYTMGIFQFTTDHSNPACVDVYLDYFTSDTETLLAEASGDGVEITAQRISDGKEEILELKGPSVVEIFSPTSFRMYMPPIA